MSLIKVAANESSGISALFCGKTQDMSNLGLLIA
jgi:hypothetical protein